MRSLTCFMFLFLMLAPGCGEDDKPGDDTQGFQFSLGQTF